MRQFGMPAGAWTYTHDMGRSAEGPANTQRASFWVARFWHFKVLKVRDPPMTGDLAGLD